MSICLKTMKTKYLILLTIILGISPKIIYSQTQIQKDSITISEAFDKVRVIETKTDVVDSLINVVSGLSSKISEFEISTLDSRKKEYYVNSKQQL